MKYKDIDIEINQETKEKFIRKRKERRSFIPTCDLPSLLLVFFLVIIPTINVICSPPDEETKMSMITFVLSCLIVSIIIGLPIFVAHCQSKRRIKYLPLDKETIKKLNINTIEDYCKFLNEFFFVTPFGGETIYNSIFLDIIEIPKEMLEEINSNFSIEDGKIAWDYFHNMYYVLRED